MSSKVYILILNWNGWKVTIECLESVFRNLHPNYQVVVLDNASTDGSTRRIKAWADGKQGVDVDPKNPLYHLSHPPVSKPIPYTEYDRKTAEIGGFSEKEKLLYDELPKDIPHPLILVQTGNNLGFAGGNNVGIRYALAKNDCGYIWLLNNDTVIDKIALNSLVEEIKKDNCLAVIGSKILYYYKPNIIQATGGGRILPWMGIERSIGTNEENKGQWDKDIVADYIAGTSFFIKADTINSVGLMDESYFLYWEETDWCERIRRKKWKLGYAWTSRVWHKGGATVGFGSPMHDYYGARNGLMFMRRYYRKSWMIGALISFAGKAFNRIRRNNYKGLRAVIEAYIDLPHNKMRR